MTRSMRAFLMATATAIALVGCEACGHEQPTPPNEPDVVVPPTSRVVEWVTHDRGLSLAASSGRKLLIYFYADWCPYCHLIDSRVWTHPAVIGVVLDSGYVTVRVDTDRDEILREAYGVSTIPKIIVYDVDEDGGRTEVTRIEGYHQDVQYYIDRLDP